MKRPSLIAGLLLSFAAASFGTPSSFVVPEDGTLTYNLHDKNGNQTVVGGFVDCTKAPCTGVTFPPGGMAQAWSYALPKEAMAIDGDVLIKGGLVGVQVPDGNDLLRFKNNVLYVFSEAGQVELFTKKEAGGFALPRADVSEVPTGTSAISALSEDIKDDANSGIVYSPKKGQPGWGPNGNTFAFQSDGNGGQTVQTFI